jgi:cytoskeletal protein RodZ
MSRHSHDPDSPHPVLPDAGGADDIVTLGELLRRTRERQGLTLEQIAQTTKIPVRHLEALELNNRDRVPSGMYQRAEIRAYADAVGLDRRLALTCLERAVEPPAVMPALLAAPPIPPRRRSRAISGLFSIGVAALVVVAAGWIAVQSLETREPSGVAAPPPRSDAPIATSGGQARDLAAASPGGVSRVTSATAAGADAAPTDAQVTDRDNDGTAPAAPQTAPAPVAYPVLQVVTVPAGARVTVDGVGRGPAPVAIRFLPPGTRRVRVTNDGYVAQERLVQVAADAPRTTVRFELRPLQ